MSAARNVCAYGSNRGTNDGIRGIIGNVIAPDSFKCEKKNPKFIFGVVKVAKMVKILIISTKIDHQLLIT